MKGRRGCPEKLGLQGRVSSGLAWVDMFRPAKGAGAVWMHHPPGNMRTARQTPQTTGADLQTTLEPMLDRFAVRSSGLLQVQARLSAESLELP